MGGSEQVRRASRETSAHLRSGFSRQFDTEVMPAEALSHDQGGPAAGEGIKDQVAGVAGYADDPFEYGFRHLAGMLDPLFEGAADARHVPGVVLAPEEALVLLRA